MNQYQAVIKHRSSFLQAISTYVRLGYRHYCVGVVSASKALGWSRKAARYYATDLDRNRRARAKKRGEGCAVLLMHEHEPERLVYVLLVTSGEHPAHRLERLCDALSEQRMTLFGYELTQLTRPKAVRPALTWRLTADAYEARREEVIDTVRRGDAMRVRQLIYSMHAAPGFAGVRKQTFKLRALFRSQWRRFRQSTPMPPMPGKIAYIRRLRIESLPLSVYLSAVARQRQLAARLLTGGQSADTSGSPAEFPTLNTD